MAQSLSRILLHVVFSTKKRVAMIPSDLAPDLHAWLGGKSTIRGVNNAAGRFDRAAERPRRDRVGLQIGFH